MADETESKQKFVIKEDDIKVFKNIEGFDNLSKLLSNIFWGKVRVTSTLQYSENLDKRILALG